MKQFKKLLIAFVFMFMFFVPVFTGCSFSLNNNSQQIQNESNNDANKTMEYTTIDCRKSSSTYYFIVRFTNNTNASAIYAVDSFSAKIYDLENEHELLLTSSVYAKAYNEDSGAIGQQYSSFSVGAGEKISVVLFIRNYAGYPLCHVELHYNTTRISQFDVNTNREIINIL